MPQWIELGNADQLAASPRTCLDAQFDGQTLPLVVFRDDAGGFNVMLNVCPHAGLPLGGGERKGPTITCPYHGYTYSIKNGRDLDDPEFGQPATVYPTRVENGLLQIELDAERSSKASE